MCIRDSASATYANKITPEDRIPNWKDSAHSLNLQIKALAHRQPVFVQIEDLLIQLLQSEVLDETQLNTVPGKISEIGDQGISVMCGKGTLQITLVKLNRGQGKPMDVKTFLNGYGKTLVPGEILAPNNGK